MRNTETPVKGVRTGRMVNVWGTVLPQVKAPGLHRLRPVEVEGVCYYIFDFGGYWVGCRKAQGEDYGGNVIHSARTAPDSLVGIAARLRGLPVRKCMGSDPEIVLI